MTGIHISVSTFGTSNGLFNSSRQTVSIIIFLKGFTRQWRAALCTFQCCVLTGLSITLFFAVNFSLKPELLTDKLDKNTTLENVQLWTRRSDTSTVHDENAEFVIS